MFTLSVATVAALIAVTSAQTLNVVNKCSEDVYLFAQTSFGTINGNVIVGAGTTLDMGISNNWDGAISTGTGCASDASTCSTGGPTWDGVTPYSRAEFNFVRIPAFLGPKMHAQTGSISTRFLEALPTTSA